MDKGNRTSALAAMIAVGAVCLPPGLARAECTISLQRAEQIDQSIQHHHMGGAIALVGGAWMVLGLAATLAIPPFGVLIVAAGYAMTAGGATIENNTPLPRTACEAAFASLTDSQRQQVLSDLRARDPALAMGPVDSALRLKRGSLVWGTNIARNTPTGYLPGRASALAGPLGQTR